MNSYLLFITVIISSLSYAQMGPDSIIFNSRKSNVSKVNETYTLKTNEKLRDNLSQLRSITIDKRYPYIESESNMFNALFSLAIEEMKENMVNSIYDSSFGQDKCDCFETGKKWNYVWTRDIAYSVNLSLAALAPKRAMNSLLFKVSNKRGQGSSSAQIIQDTGTGGSWPISTDRVTWSLGAIELIKYLKPADKKKFSTIAYTALKNTIEADREIIFDQTKGLYTGEQSFLDWREQTYPSWLKRNVIHIGMSKTLSTNIAHFVALKALVTIGKETGHSSYKYKNWARELKVSINKSFWDRKRQLYSLMLTTYLDKTKVEKFDLLGNSLAVIFNIAQTNSQKRLLKNYNMTKAGAPVIFPQDKEAAIYHNRAIWPFVSSYALLAAKKQEQSHVFNHLFKSIIVGSALNLSNMENFEFTTLRNYVNDGHKSGPVVNSQRQLWSVAGFLSTYLDGVFGKEIQDNSIRFNPFVTLKLRKSILKNTNTIELKNFIWKDKTISVKLVLPQIDNNNINENTFYTTSSIHLNHKKIDISKFHSYNSLKDQNEFIIVLQNKKNSYDRARISNSNLYSDRTPWIEKIEEVDQKLKLSFSGASNYNIYQDQKLIKSSYSRSQLIIDRPNYSTCFVIESSSMNKSFHSEPSCYWPKGSITTLDIFRRSSFISKEFTVNESGKFLAQLVFENPGDLTTGITASVKAIQIKENNKVIKTGYFFLPHTSQVSDSNFIELELEESKRYKIEIKDKFNMSYFEHFRTYIHRGGRSGQDNSAHIHSFKLLRSL